MFNTTLGSQQWIICRVQHPWRCAEPAGFGAAVFHELRVLRALPPSAQAPAAAMGVPTRTLGRHCESDQREDQARHCRTTRGHHLDPDDGDDDDGGDDGSIARTAIPRLPFGVPRARRDLCGKGEGTP